MRLRNSIVKSEKKIRIEQPGFYLEPSPFEGSTDFISFNTVAAIPYISPPLHVAQCVRTAQSWGTKREKGTVFITCAFLDRCGFLIKCCILNHQMYLHFSRSSTECYYWTQNLGQPLKRSWDRGHVSSGQKHYPFRLHVNMQSSIWIFFVLKKRVKEKARRVWQRKRKKKSVCK